MLIQLNYHLARSRVYVLETLPVIQSFSSVWLPLSIRGFLFPFLCCLFRWLHKQSLISRVRGPPLTVFAFQLNTEECRFLFVSAFQIQIGGKTNKLSHFFSVLLRNGIWRSCHGKLFCVVVLIDYRICNHQVPRSWLTKRHRDAIVSKWTEWILLARKEMATTLK